MTTQCNRIIPVFLAVLVVAMAVGGLLLVFRAIREPAPSPAKPLTSVEAEVIARGVLESYCENNELRVSDFGRPSAEPITVAPHGTPGWRFRYMLKRNPTYVVTVTWSEEAGGANLIVDR